MPPDVKTPPLVGDGVSKSFDLLASEINPQNSRSSPAWQQAERAWAEFQRPFKFERKRRRKL